MSFGHALKVRCKIEKTLRLTDSADFDLLLRGFIGT